MSCRVYTWAMGMATQRRAAMLSIIKYEDDNKDDEENNPSRRKFQFLNLLATGTAGSGKVKPTVQPRF